MKSSGEMTTFARKKAVDSAVPPDPRSRNASMPCVSSTTIASVASEPSACT